jgi:hypothetical protein
MGRPRGSKNVMLCHKAGGDRRSVKYKGQRMENKSRKEQKAREDWINRLASSRQGRPKDIVPHPASEELLKRSQELLRLVMAHPSTPKSRNLPDFINMDDKPPNDEQIDYMTLTMMKMTMKLRRNIEGPTCPQRVVSFFTTWKGSKKE